MKTTQHAEKPAVLQPRCGARLAPAMTPRVSRSARGLRSVEYQTDNVTTREPNNEQDPRHDGRRARGCAECQLVCNPRRALSVTRERRAAPGPHRYDPDLLRRRPDRHPERVFSEPGYKRAHL